MKEDVLFKKTPFGGFDRVEVISYIHQLKTTQQKYKVLLDEKEKVNTKLSRDLEERELQVSALRENVKETEEQLEKCKAQKAELAKEKENLEQKLAESAQGSGEYVAETVRMCDDLVETASDTAKKLVAAADDKLADARKRLTKSLEKLEKNENAKPEDVKKLLKKLIKELK